MALRRQLSGIPLAEGRHCILRICGNDLCRLEKHLFQRYPRREWGTFFLFGFRRTSWGLALSYVEPFLPTSCDLDRNIGITRFSHQYSRRAFQHASRVPLATGVSHSHPEGFRTWPSPLDDDMDRYFAREFMAFSGGAPYCSIILQRSNETGLTFTGRVFDRGEWLSVETLISVGDRIHRFHSELSASDANNSRAREESTTARLESIMGAKSALRLKGATIGIVGSSGSGSPAAHVLARANVGGFILVDPERLAPSNLERLHGSVQSDVDRQPPPYKVEVVRNLIQSINPESRVTTIAGNILHDNVIDELLMCDMLLGCTDTQHARAALSDLASIYLLPSLDVGVLMDGESGKISTQLLDLTAFSPELPCGFCSGRIDGIALSQELLTEEERQSRETAAREASERGDDPDMYWRRSRQFHTVGYLTTIAGSLAAGYAEGWLTGAFRFPHSSFQFDISQERFAVVAPPRSGSMECSCQKYRGWGDVASQYRNVVRPPHWTRRGLLLHRGVATSKNNDCIHVR
jgi:molybdopterin/thiamine biosynthesis adenylyltransferase